ncbi:MAG: hypothetical protein ACFFC3_13850 [Candidatus Odinarchaeota archaeon]
MTSANQQQERLNNLNYNQTENENGNLAGLVPMIKLQKIKEYV